MAKDVGKTRFEKSFAFYTTSSFIFSTRELLPGDHSVEVKLNGSHVEGSPFLIKAYDANKVKVTDINSGFVDSPVYFTSKLDRLLIVYWHVERKCSFVVCLFSKRESSGSGKFGNNCICQWLQCA